ncbi:HNH endonuclease signature motif containing protein [Saccharopolyspora sp. NPDC002578]
MRERRPNAAAEAFLFAVSTRCAFPECRIPTVKLSVDKRAGKNVQAAHIVPISPSMPRWRPMDAAVRDNYLNLVLLCDTHHHLVDKSPIAPKYTEEMLLEWKEEAEHELREKFNGIDRYSYTDIQDMIKLATSQGTEVIMSGIDELGTKVDSATAKVLTVLYEQFTDKRRDYEVAAMLNTASERLASGNFAETVHTLNGAVGRLGTFSDDAGQFNAGASMLQDFDLRAFIIAAGEASGAAETIDKAQFDTGPDTRELSHAVARQVTATLEQSGAHQQNREPQRPAPAPVESSFDTKHVFLTGLGLGVVLCVLLVWATVWLTQGP